VSHSGACFGFHVDLQTYLKRSFQVCYGTLMSRTANKKRPEELREAILEYLIEHGVSDLSLRPLAKAVGSSPRVLLYYFGSREKMLAMLFSDIRERQRTHYGRDQAATLGEACRSAWADFMSNGAEKHFRLYFEAYGLALRNPELFKDFLESTIEDWLSSIATPLSAEGADRSEARALASVILASMRGFMLDYCTTHDRDRLDRAVWIWSQALDTISIRKREV
jgi:AcrR family transcriptional regulator